MHALSCSLARIGNARGNRKCNETKESAVGAGKKLWFNLLWGSKKIKTVTTCLPKQIEKLVMNLFELCFSLILSMHETESYLQLCRCGLDKQVTQNVLFCCQGRVYRTIFRTSVTFK